MTTRAISKPDYYELRVVYADGTGHRQNFKRHGLAARKATGLAQLNQVIKCRIHWLKNRMGLPYIEKTEYIKGDKIN